MTHGSLVAHERSKNESAWALPTYGDFSPGEQYLPLFLDMSRAMMRTSVLDAGCGSGKGALALKQAGFSVDLCDLTPDGLVPDAKRLPFTQAPLWSDLKRTLGFRDWVYCCDVLEHIPTAFTMLTVTRLLEVSRRGAFFSIALVPDSFGAWVGESLHQTVQPFTWWKRHLQTVGDIIEARDLLNVGLFLVKAKADARH